MYHHEMILVIKEEAVAECLKWWHTLVHPLASELLVVLGKASGQKYSLPCAGKSDTLLCVCRMCV